MSRAHAARSTARDEGSSVRAASEARTLSREAYGSLLVDAIAAAGCSRCAVARAAGVDESYVRRWEAGDAAIPIDLLDRLPPTVAARLAQLVEERVRGRRLAADVDYLRALTAGYAAVLNARAEGGDDRPALLEVADVARAAGARGAR